MASENTNNVSVEKLTKRVGKYSLVILASERAKELKRFEERTGEITASNQVRNALTDIANAKVKMIIGDDDSNVSDEEIDVTIDDVDAMLEAKDEE